MSWQFTFTRNIHMYSHHLRCRKGNLDFDCPSEDSAYENGVTLFWIDGLPLKETQLFEFASELEGWANKQNFKFKIFIGNKCMASNVMQ